MTAKARSGCFFTHVRVPHPSDVSTLSTAKVETSEGWGTRRKPLAAARHALVVASRVIVLAALITAVFAVRSVQAGPEDRRLDAAKFREGLKGRGLTELLELYLSEVPPVDPVEALLLERDIRLVQHADPGRPDAERRDALLEANRLLERLIAEHPGDLRAFEWRMELGRALLYGEAEPFYSSILYRGGTAEDRRRLAEVTDRAVGVFARLWLELARERDRLEHIPARTYEELEHAGYIERIETIEPQADYMERWVRFYRAMAREPDDPLRAAELGAVLDDLRTRSGLLDSPHSVTHVQAQSLLLAGMAGRLLRDYVASTGYLNAAVSTVRRINDDAEREALRWVVHLALLKTVRVHRDSHRFHHAHRALREFDAHLDAAAPDDFGLRLVAALAESRVRQAQAQRARASGDPHAAATFENMRFEPLMKLARQRTAYRDEIYATLYELMDADAPLAERHPFEGCALLAGLLNDATTLTQAIADARAGGESALSSGIEQLESRRIAALDRAIVVAQHLHGLGERIPPELLPEIIYNLGVARLHRGRRLDAARAFLAVARDHRKFPQAQVSAAAAVQVASELAEDPSLRSRPKIQALYLDALVVLTTNYPHNEDARYWQFFLAQLLHDLGRYDEAAEAFARVDSGHEYAVHAEFLRIRSLVASLGERAAGPDADNAQLVRRVADVVEAVEAFVERAGAARADDFDAALLDDFLAEAELLAAEALLDAGKEQSSQALERLRGFEQRYPGQSRLVGRVLRVRIIAYEHLGRLEDAEQALPEYIRSDPDSAGATLQALFESIREDVERLKRRGRDEDADRKAAAALLLARQIHRWALADSSRVRPGQRHAIDLQLARALLQAEHYAEAERAFAACLTADANRSPDGVGHDLRAIHGHAESLYQLGQYERALPLFHRLCQALSPGDELWFKALLRDLQCRTRLEHSPEGIIKVIRQQKFLHDDMGGPELRRQFDALLRRNENRMASTTE